LWKQAVMISSLAPVAQGLFNFHLFQAARCSSEYIQPFISDVNMEKMYIFVTLVALISCLCISELR
jgi:hypothetical protein